MIQKKGKVQFLRHHDKAVKGVSFNPCDRFQFASCSSDGYINIYGSYNSSFHYLLVSYPFLGRDINAVKFSHDGRKILAALASKKFGVLDVETGQPIRVYEDCCYSGNSRDFVRIPIVLDPARPSLAYTVNTNPRGISIFDIREPLVLDVKTNICSNDIRDIIQLNNSWPFISKDYHSGLAILSNDGICKIMTHTGELVHSFQVPHKTTTLTATPELFNSSSNVGNFRSSILLGGQNFISTYTPESSPTYDKVLSRLNYPATNPTLSTTNLGFSDFYYNHIPSFSLNITSPSLNTYTLPVSIASLNHGNTTNLVIQNTNRRLSNQINTVQLPNISISQLKYGSNGGLCYGIAQNTNSVIRFRRHPNEHRIIGELYSHKSEITNLDISPYDEYLVTSSRDKTVGVFCLGSPNRGTTSVAELT